MLLELDNKAALTFYNFYISWLSAKDLLDTGLKLTFAIIEKSKRNIEKIHTLLAIDPKTNGLSLQETWMKVKQRAFSKHHMTGWQKSQVMQRN